MKPTNNKMITFKVTKNILLAMCILLFSLTAFGNYEISWYTIDGGGGQSSGGTYTLTGTIGQHDASWVMQGGEYTLSGGFWPGESVLLCTVNFEDFARFAMYWQDTPCNVGNNWCGGADIDYSGDVTILDLSEVAYFWLDFCPDGWGLE